VAAAAPPTSHKIGVIGDGHVLKRHAAHAAYSLGDTASRLWSSSHPNTYHSALPSACSVRRADVEPRVEAALGEHDRYDELAVVHEEQVVAEAERMPHVGRKGAEVDAAARGRRRPRWRASIGDVDCLCTLRRGAGRRRRERARPVARRSNGGLGPVEDARALAHGVQVKVLGRRAVLRPYTMRHLARDPW
jgi:hypothetical protein